MLKLFSVRPSVSSHNRSMARLLYACLVKKIGIPLVYKKILDGLKLNQLISLRNSSTATSKNTLNLYKNYYQMGRILRATVDA